MPNRGTYSFEVSNDGGVKDSPGNLELLRRLFLDGNIIRNRYGPGRPGDFDNGGWHVTCHLVAGGAVLRSQSGDLVWEAVTHDDGRKLYQATVTKAVLESGVTTVPLDSQKGRDILEDATLLGYVEGTSQGHISARDADDPSDAFNGWPRQKYDHSTVNPVAGGTVWEHWCTLRDIRSSAPIGTSVLSAYLTLVSQLGGQFVATVARGRRSYSHPIHICAMIKSGFITKEDALWDTMPEEIPGGAQRRFYKAEPEKSLEAAGRLSWPSGGSRRYHMFERRIGEWSKASDVRRDIEQFGL